MSQPRIRMFAGPNGSGKSTIIQYLLPHQIGTYLNADDLEKQLKQTQRLDLSHYHDRLDASKLIDFLTSKNKKHGDLIFPLLSQNSVVQQKIIQFSSFDIDSYLAARIIDFIRFEFLTLKISFTFETVMSHDSKVDFLKQAQQKGFKTY